MPQVIPFIVYVLAESSPYLTALEVAGLTVASSTAVLAYEEVAVPQGELTICTVLARSDRL